MSGRTRFVGGFLLLVLAVSVFCGALLYQRDEVFGAAVQLVVEPLETGIYSLNEALEKIPVAVLFYGAEVVSREMEEDSTTNGWDLYRTDPYLLEMVPRGECRELSQELGWACHPFVDEDQYLIFVAEMK